MTNDVVHLRAAGMDISKTDAKVCLRLVQPDGQTIQHQRVFDATTGAIRELRQWLIDAGIDCVVMEATSSYWKPFYYGLEDGPFEVLLANARQVKQLKGRKTDRADAAWLAKLAGLGVVAGSFVPPPEVRDLRLLVRTRDRLVRTATAQSCQLEKLLEDAGIKLSAVSSKLLTVSGRSILEQIRDGQTNLDALADLSRLRVSRDTVKAALDGHVRDVHRDLIRVHLDLLDHFAAQLRQLDEAIDAHVGPVQDAIDLLVTIPGLSTRLATTLIAETGPTMTVFPTPGHLVSWSGLAPGNHESAGKTRRVACRAGNRRVKTAATMAAMVLIRQPDTFFGARYHRIRARRGHNVALVAVARSLIMAVWAVLATGQPYHDLGPDWHARALTAAQRRHRLARAEAILRQLGVEYILDDTSSRQLPALEAA
jgi:transposase